jgi:hypothetical protein
MTAVTSPGPASLPFAGSTAGRSLVHPSITVADR